MESVLQFREHNQSTDGPAISSADSGTFTAMVKGVTVYSSFQATKHTFDTLAVGHSNCTFSLKLTSRVRVVHVRGDKKLITLG